MMKTLLIKILTALSFTVLVFLNTQCSRFVEIPDPTDQISQATVFKDKATALAALADVYANLRSNSVLDGTTRGANFLTGCYTDEISTISNQPGGFRSFYDHSVIASNSTVDQLWISTYRSIYAVNNILEGVSRSGDYLDESTRNMLTGEATTIRALLHLYLTNLYGAIPYITSTDYQVNQTVSKSTVPKIYDLITEDLLFAETLLKDDYPNPGRTRVNKSAVRLLLARTYLYAGKNERARDYAQLVMGNAAYKMEPSPDKVFVKEAKSTIWQFAPVELGANTLEGLTYIIWETPPPYGFLSSNLLGSFENGDLRAGKWIASVSENSTTYFYPYKYKEFEKTPVSLEYSIVLRLEEAILIAAEVEHNLGNTASALQYLGLIRLRAGLTTPSTGSSQQVMSLIVNEKRHEFFTEGAHRFFDLKRWGLLDTVMSSTKPNWQPYMKNWPLPQRELLINANLNPQNDGY